jgi:hypothetical protein
MLLPALQLVHPVEPSGAEVPLLQAVQLLLPASLLYMPEDTS